MRRENLRILAVLLMAGPIELTMSCNWLSSPSCQSDIDYNCADISPNCDEPGCFLDKVCTDYSIIDSADSNETDDIDTDESSDADDTDAETDTEHDESHSARGIVCRTVCRGKLACDDVLEDEEKCKNRWWCDWWNDGL